MTGWPAYSELHRVAGGVITTLDTNCSLVEQSWGASPSSATWPAANRALYYPFLIENQVTVYHMFWRNGTAVSGTLDVGLYDELGNRLYGWAAAHSNTGITQTGTNVLQTADIADTTLNPGVYFMAMCVDNTTATMIRTLGNTIAITRVHGVQQQAVGSVVLPDPATFTADASAYTAWMGCGLNSVI